MTEPVIGSSEGFPGQSWFIMEYIEGGDGLAITQASLDEIVMTVYLGDTGQVLFTETLVIADTVFDTPQTNADDDRWEDQDDLTEVPGYNFGYQVPAEFCPPAGETYLYKFVGTESPGGADALNWQVYHYRTALAVGSANPVSGVITIRRGDRISIPMPLLGDISARTKLWLVIKANANHEDSDAMIFITESGGLITFDGADASSSALGSLTVTDATTGATTFFLDKTLSAQLRAWKSFVFDLQWQGTNILTTPRRGRIVVASDVTRATS